MPPALVGEGDAGEGPLNAYVVLHRAAGGAAQATAIWPGGAGAEILAEDLAAPGAAEEVLARLTDDVSGTCNERLLVFDAVVWYDVLRDLVAGGGALALLNRVVAENRMLDLLRLHQLVRLAVADELPDALEGSFDKLAAVWNTPADGATVAEHMVAVRAKIEAEARRIAAAVKRGVYKDAAESYGLLSEGIQVQGAIALHQISERGMAVDTEALGKLRDSLTAERIVYSRQMPTRYVDFFQRYDALLSAADGEAVDERERRAYHNELREILAEVMAELQQHRERPLNFPTRENGLPSLMPTHWQEYVDMHPFLRVWHHTERIRFLFRYVRAVDAHLRADGTVHPRYIPMVRNGRTSCEHPNIQHIPREQRFRSCFVARPGHFLVSVDYTCIELVTLAAVCQERFKFSALGDILTAGGDPHVHTAAVLEDVTVAEMKAWRAGNDPALRQRYFESRQKAKAFNFGIAGGLGAGSLRSLALDQFGVFMTFEEAQKLRKLLLRGVYPEIGMYLSDNNMRKLANNLGVSSTDLWDDFLGIMKGDTVFDAEDELDLLPSIGGDIRDVMRGVRRDGLAYHPDWVDRVWVMVRKHANNPELAQVLDDPEISRDDILSDTELYNMFFGETVGTLTGRIRGPISYSQARNTPFSGLAADGAKLALFALEAHGHRVVAFIHDEVLVEIPDDADIDAAVQSIERTMCEAMEDVVRTIPVRVSASMGAHW